MKVTATDLQTLRKYVVAFDTEPKRELYRSGNFPRAELVKDLDRRYRWDLFSSAFYLIPSELVSKYQDAHLDTALRAIVRPLAEQAAI